MTILYLDMDGVVADFNRYASEILNKQQIVHDRWDDEDWNILKENPNKINWNILSRNPSAIHILEQNLDKIDWWELS